MDPNACLQRIIAALAQDDDATAAESFYDLRGWLYHGGFAPRAFADHPEIADAYRRGFVHFVGALQRMHLEHNA